MGVGLSSLPPSPYLTGVLAVGENLRNGIWPRSTALWLTGVYVALYIIRPWEVLFPWLMTIRFERLYAILMLAVVLLSNYTRLKLSFQSMCVVAFLISVILSAGFALDTQQAWPVVFEFMTVAFFYFILLACIRTPYDLIFIASCYVLAMFLYLAKAQWEFWINGQHQYDMGVIRLVGIEGTFSGPNSLAMSIVAAFPLWLFLWQTRTRFCATWPQRHAKWFARMLKVYLILAVLSLVLTNSRSGMLGGVLFLAFRIMRGRGIAQKALFLLGGLVLLSTIWIFLPQDTKTRYVTIVDPSAGPQNAQTSAEGRVEGFKAGVEMFKKYPIFGVGIGNFIRYRMTQGDKVYLNAHSLVGQVLGETGFAGAITFIMMVGVALVNTRRLRKMSQEFEGDDPLRMLDLLGIAVRTSVVLLLFEGLFGHNLNRFNWFWLAAFAELAVRFAVERCQNRHGGVRL